VSRAVVLCPGRGSYTEASLGSLDPDHEFVRIAERCRGDLGLEPLLALDRAERFEPARHLRPAHVSPLILVKAMIDAEAASRAHEVVAVGGNSLGWYIALCVAGSVSFEEGFRLVQRMSLLQEEHAEGGQVLYPRIDEDWRPSAELEASIASTLESSGGEAMRSIELGGYAVLAGSPDGVRHLLSELPQVRFGAATYPIRLAQHGPYHTHLAAPVAAAAAHEFRGLQLRAPAVTLIDGRGRRHSPWSTDVEALKAYTFGHQVSEPFDFSATVRVALREFAPDRIVLPGPGNTLGGIVGQVLVAEGWRGIQGKDDFLAMQAGPSPLVESLGLGA